jgi:hypothetical protein
MLVWLGLLPLGLLAQDPGIPPDIPDLIRVSVDHADNGVLIQWEASSDTAVDLYQMYRMNNGTGTPIFTFSSETFEYKHMTSGLENLAYSVTAIDTMDGTRSRESLIADNIHRAVALSLDFDPCEPANILQWTGYEGWEGKISGYRIYGGIAGTSLQELKFVHASTRSYIHRNVSYDTTYQYYVETVHTSGISSLSPLVSITTAFPEAPEPLRIDYVSVIDRSTVELQFTSDVEGPVNSFRVMKRSSQAASYTEVETLLNATQVTRVVTDMVPTLLSSYEYIVQAIYQPENCLSPLVVGESNPGTSMLLVSSLEDHLARLNWTPYKSYAGGLSGYIIQRRSGQGEFIDVETVGPETTAWTESVESVINGYQPGELQYKVIAVENRVEDMDPAYSLSNTVSVAVETNLQLPSAFTPGSNDMNFEFKPRIDFAPEDYIMIIYDRGGRKLFESTDPGQGWDGTYRGGGYVMEGVYVYFVQYTDYTGRTLSLSGNVTAIYP